VLPAAVVDLIRGDMARIPGALAMRERLCCVLPVQHCTERILTTYTGGVHRPPDILAILPALGEGTRLAPHRLWGVSS